MSKKSVPHRSRKRKGFSLLELLAVVTILGVIAAVVIPRINTSTKGAQEEVNKQNISEINGAVERFYFETGDWPKNNLSDIGANPNYFPDGVPVNPVTGNAYKLNGTTHRVIK